MYRDFELNKKYNFVKKNVQAETYFFTQGKNFSWLQKTSIHLTIYLEIKAQINILTMMTLLRKIFTPSNFSQGGNTKTSKQDLNITQPETICT